MPVQNKKTALGLMVVLFGLFWLVGPATAADTDSDQDGLSDEAEISTYHTDPANPDTDNDGFPDGQEIENGFSPRHGQSVRLVDVDSDQDYLIDAWELAIGSDLLNPDTDGDRYLDGTEVAASFDPLDARPLKLAKRIEVDLSEQKLAYYFNDRLFEEFLISGGLARTPTPTGDFRIQAKVPVKHYGGPGFDYPNTKWNLQFTTSPYNGWRYYIHGAYWHSNWGQPMSHGCVNVDYDPMERLYWWAQLDTPVRIRG